jgi:hypothetical protein
MYIEQRCKNNTIPILMHQMRISIIYISSVMFRQAEKKMEIRNVMTNDSQNIPPKQSAVKWSQTRRRIELVYARLMRELNILDDGTYSLLRKHATLRKMND